MTNDLTCPGGRALIVLHRRSSQTRCGSFWNKSSGITDTTFPSRWKY